jgi:Family of unknown function (DUF6152)
MRLGLFTLLACAAVPLAAHHSVQAMYDENKVVTLQGVITKVEWLNPHARFWIDVKDAGGRTSSWAVELRAPNALTRAGFAKDLLKQGDPITVEGWPAKDNSNLATAGTLTLAGGQVLKSDPRWGMEAGKPLP